MRRFKGAEPTSQLPSLKPHLVLKMKIFVLKVRDGRGQACQNKVQLIMALVVDDSISTLE